MTQTGIRRQGRHTAPGKESFDADLRRRDPSWGVPCLDEVTALAEEQSFQRVHVAEMPANNLSVVFRKAAQGNSLQG